MKKTFTYLLMLMLWAFAHAAQAQTKTVTFDPSVTRGTNSKGNGSDQMTLDGVTIFVKSGQFDPDDSKNKYIAYRFYANNYFTVSATSNILSIEFTAPTTGYSNFTLPAGQPGSISSSNLVTTWTASKDETKEVKFFCPTKKQSRATKIIVTIADDNGGGGETPITVSAPTISGTTPFDASTEVTISAEEGATISYSTDEKATWNTYTNPFTLTETTTVYAKAAKGEVESDVAEMKFTKNEAPVTDYMTLGEFLEKQPSTTTTVQIKDAVVLAVSTAGTSIAVQDETGAIDIYNIKKLNLDVKEGDVITALVKGIYKLYNGTPSFDGATISDVTKVEGNTLPAPIEIKTVEDFENNLNRRVKMVFETNNDDEGFCLFDYYKKGITQTLVKTDGIKMEAIGQCRKYVNPKTNKTSYEVAPLSDDDITVIYDESHATNPVAGVSCNVRLERTVGFKAGQWGTLTLPFNVAYNDIPAMLGEGAVVAEFISGTANSINFSTKTSGDLEAGVPYLVKATKDLTQLNVKASSTITNASAQTSTGDVYSFVGVLSEDSPAAGSLYVSGTNLKPLSEGGKIKPFRAYFSVNNAATAKATTFSVDGVVTAIDIVPTAEDAAKKGVYNLAGQRVADNLDRLPAGVYIVGHKKVIIK